MPGIQRRRKNEYFSEFQKQKEVELTGIWGERSPLFKAGERTTQQCVFKVLEIGTL